MPLSAVEGVNEPVPEAETDHDCVPDPVLVPGAVKDALCDALALPVTMDGVFVAVAHADAEKERVPVTDGDTVGLIEDDPEKEEEPESERVPLLLRVPPAAGWPDSVIEGLTVMEDDAEVVGVEVPLEESEPAMVADALALGQRVPVRDTVGLREMGGLRDAEVEKEGRLTVGSMVLESVG